MASTARSRLVEDIEHKTGQDVIIATAETAEAFSKCHPQDQSPLFKLLPRELRDYIWAYATAPVEDEAHPYKRTEFYYRPGHTAKLTTDYNLLLTCRQVWLEAYELPMLQAEHAFWYHRPAPDARTKEWMASLTSLNRKNFGTLHLYVQMYVIEKLRPHQDSIKTLFFPESTPGPINGRIADFQPSTFHVTLRHTDWWHWEQEQPLRFDYKWFQVILDHPDLRRTETIKLELETLDYKVAQLNPIVETIKSLQSEEYRSHVVSEKPTSTKFVLAGEPKVTTWSGPTNINGTEYNPYKDMKELKYHVVILTWHLHFPQYPKAHIARLRLTPEVYHKRGVVGNPQHRARTARDQEIRGLPFDSDRRLAVGIPQPQPASWYWKPPTGQRSYHANGHLAWMGKPLKRKRGADGENIDEDDLTDESLRVQDHSAWQARVGEFFRRCSFWQVMKPLRQKHWREKFTATNSLLSLEDERISH